MSKSITKLVIATHNQGKLDEIKHLLGPFGVECVSAGDLDLPEPEETGTTFVENALIKAHAAANASQLPALADDSGLSVTSLEGRPGVYTADWAKRQKFEGPEGRDWFLAMGKVEGLLAEKGADVDRSARYNCVLALAWPDGQFKTYEGCVQGNLVWPPQSKYNFGFDPIFVPEGESETFDTMDREKKAMIDHRADAFAKLVAEQFSS